MKRMTFCVIGMILTASTVHSTKLFRPNKTRIVQKLPMNHPLKKDPLHTFNNYHDKAVLHQALVPPENKIVDLENMPPKKRTRMH